MSSNRLFEGKKLVLLSACAAVSAAALLCGQVSNADPTSIQRLAAPSVSKSTPTLKYSKMSQINWVNLLKDQIPALECTPQSPAVTCFKNMTPSECTTQMRSEISICATKARLPASIDRAKEGTILAFKIGNCAGARFEDHNLKRLNSSSECSTKGGK